MGFERYLLEKSEKFQKKILKTLAKIHYLALSFLIVFLSSSVVERSAVNRLVVGSNPTWGV